MTSVTPEVAPEGSTPFPSGLAYVGYGAFRAAALDAAIRAADRRAAAQQAEDALDSVVGIAVRGWYDTSGYRPDCDLLVWLAGPSADTIQAALAGLRQSRLGRALTPFWSAIGVHREAEFSKSHVPAFYAGEPPHRYVCVYPFVRTPEWYLLTPERRRDLLIEHGEMGRGYPDVRANTVSAFGLGDYEWLLAFEADDLVRIVDLIRHLRAAEARLYTKHELPFITGARRPLADILESLP